MPVKFRAALVTIAGVGEPPGASGKLGHGDDLVGLHQLRVCAGGVVGKFRSCSRSAEAGYLAGVRVGDDAEE